MTDQTFTVGEFTRAVNYALQDAFTNDVWVTGEISGLKRVREHVYFDLIDPTDDSDAPSPASVPVALFSTNKAFVNRQLKALGVPRMDNGVRVRIRGAVAYNERGSRVQIRMTGIDAQYTLSQAALDRDRVLRALRAEGLIDRNARLAMPAVPLRVGLITSAGSAAYHDFVHELETSGYAFVVTLIDTRVQGTGAADGVVRALRTLAGRDVDVIALVRGGGSRADLATFDGERLARTIATLDRPVITGVGHEVDRSIADDVAHTAYKTPTACAASLARAVHTFYETTEGLWLDIKEVALAIVDEHDELLRDRAAAAATAARGSIRGAQTKADHLATRVAREASFTVRRADQGLQRRHAKTVANAQSLLRRGDDHLTLASRSISGRAPRELTNASRQLEGLALRLRALDPSRVLARGWSITRQADGSLVRSAGSVPSGTVLRTTVADGVLTSRVSELDLAESDRDHA